MPTFDYQCPYCKQISENIRVDKHTARVTCISCSKEKGRDIVMKKMICAPNIGGMDNLGRSK